LERLCQRGGLRHALSRYSRKLRRGLELLPPGYRYEYHSLDGETYSSPFAEDLYEMILSDHEQVAELLLGQAVSFPEAVRRAGEGMLKILADFSD
jgi:hypothetical protein